ncbi:pimeloyl-ACP methyl ester carboxylesterase [Pseudoteredinibacter isoporae]|uniref:Pimeloyl-ACP methyl ester carboxylesterase n=2 Tax=Pseudoteredinibacter isoporae TaxID=570281 RepID=A0A7X0JVU4_9GAMM|nr:hypothetical protein [Pseudoteredinibacter isoporae]MBB6523197.1 pimeloyl-ACP methyl ester carboxylesterase [Pseudoteredinibacter isoporae]
MLASRSFILSMSISIALLTSLLPSKALSLSCGSYNFPACSGAEDQFAGGFAPVSGYGGFGGGQCSASKTPVIFIHGNGDQAINWDAPPTQAAPGYSLPSRSVYDEFKARGYNDCELFGISYLSPYERSMPGSNYHEDDKQAILADFIDSVKTYTGKNEVDIVAHSLGVSMALSSLKRYSKWGSVRRFINIAGAVRGLQSCRYVGYANPLFSTCAGQNIYDSYTFGLHPSTGAFYVSWGRNDWTGSSSNKSMRRAPQYNSAVKFYTLHAGFRDQVHCSTLIGYSVCDSGSLFNNRPNVQAQINVGAGSLASSIDMNFDDFSPLNLLGGDADGVGHFGAKINTGVILYEMLNSQCSGTNCAGQYSGPVQ